MGQSESGARSAGGQEAAEAGEPQGGAAQPHASTFLTHAPATSIVAVAALAPLASKIATTRRAMNAQPAAIV